MGSHGFARVGSVGFVLVVVGCAGGASPSPEVGSSAAPLSAACRSAHLVAGGQATAAASRSASFDPPFAFALPARVEVTRARHDERDVRVELDVTTDDGATLRCTYRAAGDADRAHHDGYDRDARRAPSSEVVRCADAGRDLRAGDKVTATALALRIDDDHSGAQATVDLAEVEPCRGDRCAGLGPADLDDGNPCTADACDPALGPTHTPVAAGTSCSDGDLCDGDETCDGSGVCVAGAKPPVDDGNPCTDDACDPIAGVTHVPRAAGASCADGDVCNGDETCDGQGACVAGAPPVVDDGNPCTADACDPVAGVSHVPVAAGSSCSDGDACDGDETCDGQGACVAGTPLVVDDGNPCTTDECDPLLGVVHSPAPQGTSCADQNACNGSEVCDGAGACVAGPPPVIDDGNVCTTDACDPVLGVTHTPVAVGTVCDTSDPICKGILGCGATGRCDDVLAPPFAFCGH